MSFICKIQLLNLVKNISLDKSNATGKNMKIECNDHTVKEIFESSYYEIPRFQRPYSWEIEHLEDFWKDVFKSDQKDYFIGSIVTYKHSDARAIVDGQQRLTTLTILLAALRDAFDSIGSSNQANGIHRLIERYDLENKARYVLATETSYPYLQSAIQHRTPDANQKVTGDEDEQLGSANEFFRQRVGNETQTAKVTGLQNEPAIKGRIHRKLEQLRDTVLALKLILVQLDNEDDAYLVFETLNTRGKDLTTSDLLKNLLARLIRSSNARGDSVRVKWGSLTENIKAIQLDDVSVDEFVYHYWLAKNDFTKSRDIFKAAKKSITAKASALKTLNELESYSTIYRNIFRSNFRNWRNDELKIKGSIEVVINRFRVRQPLPLILTAVAKYEQNTLSKNELERLLSAIELFTFAHTGLMGARSTGGILQMYSVHARELSRSVATTRREKTIDDLIRKLQSKLPTKEIFIKKFSELKYSDSLLSDKRLIQFSLNKLMEHIAPSLALDSAAMSIEHIAAQSELDFSKESIASIGNLWLLNTRFNNDLGRMSVIKKLKEYQKAKTPSDQVLCKAEVWSAQVVEERAVHLAEIMWDVVDSAFK
jgi:uncharacterized protein with ParB-like and HNH nuclease domain